ncbi:hypothetical protein Bca4012_091578 [Brassica carinata]
MASNHEFLARFVEETTFYNRIVLSHLLPANLWEPLPHFLQTWLRNYLAGNLLYFISGFLWCFYIYYLKLNVYVPQDSVPTRKAMILQIYVAMKAMPWSTLVPTVSEYIIERGWTKCYSTLDQFNWCLWLAFHPLDGILQAVPHVIALFIVPIHLITHLSLLIMEGIWTVSNHDCINGNIWPIMGAGHHTIHHTTYKHNYGHYTICMDWLFGSLKVPLAEDDSFNEKEK